MDLPIEDRRKFESGAGNGATAAFLEGKWFSLTGISSFGQKALREISSERLGSMTFFLNGLGASCRLRNE